MQGPQDHANNLGATGTLVVVPPCCVPHARGRDRRIDLWGELLAFDAVSNVGQRHRDLLRPTGDACDPVILSMLHIAVEGRRFALP